MQSTMLSMKVQGQVLAPSARGSTAVSMLPLRASFVAAPRVARVGARMPSVRAAATSDRDGMVEFANGIGLPTEEGLLGFTPFAEQWTGRLAMMGFLTSMVEEAMTGRGTLGQIGISSPDNTLLIVLTSLSVGATLVGLGATLNNARTGKMSLRELARYRAFLGMKGEAADIAATQRAMKLTGDFTSPDNSAAIEAARAAGTPADAFLAPTNDAAVSSAAEDLKQGGGVFALETEREAAAAAMALKEREASLRGPSVSLSARDDIQETGFFTKADMDYAKGVELSNGRWAMLGFLAAVLVEAGTGNGILMQLVSFCKWSGLLGPMSGF